MNAAEIGDLLGFAALYDNRKVADPDVMAWLRAIGDLPYADAEAAVAAHYGDSTERILPGHIRARVKAMRADRLARSLLPAPSAELADEPGRYRAAVQAAIRDIADARSVHRAIGGGKPLAGEPPAEWTDAKDAITEASKAAPKDPQQIAAEQAAEARLAREEAARRTGGTE